MSRQEDTTIKLAADSFTASRFLYGGIEEISATSASVLLGGLPNFWYREQKQNLLKTWAKRTYTEVRQGLEDLNTQSKRLGLTDISHDLRSRKVVKLFKRLGTDSDDDEEGEEEVESDTDSEEYNRGQDDHTHIVHTEAEMDVLTPQGLFEIDGHSSEAEEGSFPPTDVPSSVPETLQTLPGLQTAETHITNGTLGLSPPTGFPTPGEPSFISTTDRSFYTAEEPNSMDSGPSIAATLKSPSNNTSTEVPEIVVDDQHYQDNTASPDDTVTPVPPLSIASTLSNKSLDVLRPVSAQPTEIEPESDLESDEDVPVRVKFNEVGRTRASSRINTLKPSPETDIEVESLDPRRELAIEKVKTVASMTKRKIRKDMKRVRQKQLYKRVVKNFYAGEIIKMEKMLVLVKMPASGSKVAGFTNFTEVEPCDTRVLERWEEYIVVTRSSGDIEEPILIQFYTTREIPDTADSKHTKDQLDFTLTKDCHVSFYSTLDRTISLIKDDKIFLLRCQTPTSSIRWFTFFNEILGTRSPHTISIEIPRLKLAINLNLSRTFYDKVLEYDFKEVVLQVRDKGYYMIKQPIVDLLSMKIKRKLIQAGYSDIVDNFENTEDIVGVCWRYYDRLEWLFGETLGNLFFQQAMHFTHQLELRYVKHYPRTIEDEETHEVTVEPTPIEGFLLRLTTKEGNLRRGLFNKQVFGFNYFKTCDHLLFFANSLKAIPPIPFRDRLFDAKYFNDDENFKEISNSIPEVYVNNPFELDANGHTAWLKPDISAEDFHKRDLYGLYDFERRVNLIRAADNVLNLLEVEDICEYDATDIPLAVEAASHLLWSEPLDIHNRKNVVRDSYFQIKMKNGTAVVLKAHTRACRDEWINRLSELRSYWEKRVLLDNELIRELRDDNAEKLKMDDSLEGNFDLAPKWEATRGEAKAEIFNITPYAVFRPIIRSGFLFQKPKKHSTFRKYFVVTVPGYILLYQIVVRSVGGHIKPTTHYKHYMTIPLAECYIYSGPICSLDLLAREADIDTSRPGKTLLPRVYEDGWLSSDDEPTRCFTLWFGSKRAIAGKALQKLDSNNASDATNPSLFRMASRLGVTGQSMVFMCRSRQERDLWVSNLYTELERFGKANEN